MFLVIGSFMHIVYVQTHMPFVYDEMNWLELNNEWMVYTFSITFILLIRMPEEYVPEGDINNGMLATSA